MDCSRREFVRDGVLVAAGAAVLPGSSSLFAVPRPPWPIGCFNRPWTQWSFKQTLAAIKSAGCTSMGLLTPTPQDPFIGEDAAPEYLAGLKAAIAASGVRAVMGSLRSRHDIPLAETITSLHRQIDHAGFLGLESVITFGTDHPDQVDHYLSRWPKPPRTGRRRASRW